MRSLGAVDWGGIAGIVGPVSALILGVLGYQEHTRRTAARQVQNVLEASEDDAVGIARTATNGGKAAIVLALLDREMSKNVEKEVRVRELKITVRRLEHELEELRRERE